MKWVLTLWMWVGVFLFGAKLDACAWLPMIGSIFNPKESESDHQILGSFVGATKHILLESEVNRWGEHDQTFREIRTKPLSDWARTDDVKKQNLKRMETLRVAHQAALAAAKKLKKIEWTEDRAKRIFAQFFHDFLIHNAFLETFRFVVSSEEARLDYFAEWDEVLVSLKPFLLKHLPAQTKEGAWAIEFVKHWGQDGKLWSFRHVGVMLQIRASGHDDHHLYQKWDEYRSSVRPSAEALLKRWKRLEEVIQALPIGDENRSGSTGIAQATPAPENVSQVLGQSPLVDAQLEDDIDGSLVGPQKSSGIRKPGANRTADQKYKFATPQERKKLDAQKRDAKLRQTIREKGLASKPRAKPQ